MKRQRHFAGSFHQEHRYHYEVALEIAMPNKKTHDWRNACETQFVENSKNTSWRS